VKIVNGASLQPLSGKSPKQIVLLLHGFGSSGQDMISLAPDWQAELPDALFLAPHAPQRSLAGIGYQWWPLTEISPRALALGASSVAPALNSFIDRKLEQYGLSGEDLALVGFSQGTIMALHVGLRRERRVAAVVGYSGLLAGSPELPTEIRSRPPTLLVHGVLDAIVPISALYSTEQELQQLGVEVKTHISYGVGHTVDPVGMKAGRDFIKTHFAL